MSKNSKKQLVYARKNKPKRDKLEKLRKKVEVEAKQEFVAAITDEDIAEVVSQWTGIPLKQMEKKKANVSCFLKKIAPTRDWTRRSGISGRSFDSPCS